MSSMVKHKCSGLPKFWHCPHSSGLWERAWSVNVWGKRFILLSSFWALPDIPISCLQAFLCNEESSRCLSWELSFSPYQIAPGLKEKPGVKRISTEISSFAFGGKFVLETLEWARGMWSCMGGHHPGVSSLNSTSFATLCENKANLG